jgi:D-alanine-D-alanine ligase-like ATP-grasp enzyme
VNERELGNALDAKRDKVHGVGAQHNPLCASQLQLHGRLVQKQAGLIPLSRMLEFLDLSKIEGEDDTMSGMQASLDLPYATVDFLIISHGGLPAHATEQA